MGYAGDMCIRHGRRCSRVGRDPLLCTGRALDELPFVLEQGLEVAVVPGDRRGSPGTLETTRDRVLSVAGTEAVLPAQAHLLNRSTLRLGSHVLAGIARAVSLAEGVTTGDECNCLLVIHGHASKGLADVACRGQRIRVAVGAFGIDVDQAHLNGTKRILELAVTGVAAVFEPGSLRAPVRDVIGLPGINASASEAEHLQAHGFHGNVSGEQEEICPGDLLAVLLLDRPEQSTCLVEVDVVGPAVQGCEAMHARSAAATAVSGAVGAGAVPCHANEEGTVVAVVSGPPLLGVGHDGSDVCLELGVVQRVELLGVIEIITKGARRRRIDLQQLQVELIGPPVVIGGSGDGLPGAATGHRALCLCRHVSLLLIVVLI